MREMLNDDIQRRYYILDGDIEVIISEFLQNDCHCTLYRFEDQSFSLNLIAIFRTLLQPLHLSYQNQMKMARLWLTLSWEEDDGLIEYCINQNAYSELQKHIIFQQH